MSITKLLFPPVILLLALFSGPGDEHQRKLIAEVTGDTLATLTIEGLPYPCCICYVETQVAKFQGVQSVTSNYWQGKVEIRYHRDKISLDQLIGVLRDLGVEIPPRKDNPKSPGEKGKEKLKDWRPKNNEDDAERLNLA